MQWRNLCLETSASPSETSEASRGIGGSRLVDVDSIFKSFGGGDITVSYLNSPSPESKEKVVTETPIL